MLKSFGIILRSFTTNTQKVTEYVPNEDIVTKLLKVAVIGMPNSGKSTFINYLMDRKVCPTSSKVHTTRAKSMAIFTEADSQIVFLDTPGLVNLKEQKKFNLEKCFLRDSKSSIYNADIVGVIHDASNVWTREKLDLKIIRLLENHEDKPSFLVLNKVDLIKSKRKLLDITRLLTDNCINGKPIATGHPRNSSEDDIKIRGWPNFQEVFMISALTGSGLAEVKNYLIRQAKPSKWMFPPDVWSDQTTQDLIVNSTKAKFLDFLPQEIPYNLKPQLEFLNINENGIMTVVVVVECPSERIAKLVAGVSDGKLRQITESLQNDLQNVFQNFVRLKVVLQAPKDD